VCPKVSTEKEDRMNNQGKSTTNDYAEWIDTMQFDFCVTLTRRDPLSIKGIRETNEHFFDFMRQRYKKARFLWVAEPHDVATSYHSHGLFALGESVEGKLEAHAQNLKDGWRIVSNGGKGGNSWTVIEPYIKGGGWARYLAKNIDKDNTDWFIHGT
jgi:hypothetical protein